MPADETTSREGAWPVWKRRRMRLRRHLHSAAELAWLPVLRMVRRASMAWPAERSVQHPWFDVWEYSDQIAVTYIKRDVSERKAQCVLDQGYMMRMIALSSKSGRSQLVLGRRRHTQIKIKIKTPRTALICVIPLANFTRRPFFGLANASMGRVPLPRFEWQVDYGWGW